MKYIFIRHGKTHFNEIGLKQGWCDSPLTKEGIQQIEKMTQLLKDEKITKAYTSPTPRAKQTAQIILKEHDVLLHEDERFKEVNFGVLEGLPCSFVDTLRLESTNWLEDLKLDYTSYQGENIDDVIIRQQEVLKEIEKISNEEDCIVVVGHGCSLYALIKTLLKDEKLIFPENASAYIFYKKNNEYKLEKYLRP
ncbi:histidine phosphatase family protein [Faecalibacillus faecis]|uniref:histidine phosphatase family protein n=1 Tax=Faecalibacillus faecis TaxID=1982628 RepID=UPI000E532EC0|nr:histidine phosphatase family protein [Faecalibacillus faecis]RGT59598.1 histidine phosphatase family protein [Coprobacillus sp. AF18-40]RGT81062.1 histidine phosphatase family protein [Coprobacillus sp. AF18-15LB]